MNQPDANTVGTLKLNKCNGAKWKNKCRNNQLADSTYLYAPYHTIQRVLENVHESTFVVIAVTGDVFTTSGENLALWRFSIFSEIRAEVERVNPKGTVYATGSRHHNVIG